MDLPMGRGGQMGVGGEEGKRKGRVIPFKRFAFPSKNDEEKSTS